jgi:hypothetical protein
MKSTLDRQIRKVHFDMQPTDPQNDFKGTGNCELWNRQVDLIIPPPVRETTHDSEQYDTPSQPPQAEDWLTKVTFPKFQTLPEVTCVYGMDGKCSGTITPQRLIILQDAYNSARHRGTHALLIPPVQDLATEIHPNLLHRLQRLSMTSNNTKAAHPIHDSLSQPRRPGHKRKNGLPLDFTPELQEFWTAHLRETFWFQNRCVLHTIHWFLHLPPDVWR